MKMHEALEIINSKPTGFMVSFERLKNGFLYADYFPDVHAGEEPIKTEYEAGNGWEIRIKNERQMRKYLRNKHEFCTCSRVSREKNYQPMIGLKDAG